MTTSDDQREADLKARIGEEIELGGDASTIVVVVNEWLAESADYSPIVRGLERLLDDDAPVMTSREQKAIADAIAALSSRPALPSPPATGAGDEELTYDDLLALPGNSVIHVPNGSAVCRKAGDGSDRWLPDYGFGQRAVPSVSLLDMNGSAAAWVVLHNPALASRPSSPQAGDMEEVTLETSTSAANGSPQAADEEPWKSHQWPCTLFYRNAWTSTTEHLGYSCSCKTAEAADERGKLIAEAITGELTRMNFMAWMLASGSSDLWAKTTPEAEIARVLTPVIVAALESDGQGQ